jgi:hypothetical protein
MQKHISTTSILMGVFLCCIGFQPSYAQRPGEHTLQLNYGPMAREQVLEDAVFNYFRQLFSQPLRDLDFSRSYSLSYHYQARRRLAFGAMSGFTSGSNFRVYFSDSKDDYTHNNFMMAFETKFTYSDQPLVQLYAVAGLGGVLAREKNELLFSNTKTYIWPTCQLTPFGIRYGKKFGAFAEIGYGYKGVVNLGLSARF